MKCSVCGAETRCYQLREIIEHPGMVRNGEGMIFRICPDCLGKLAEKIKTGLTKIEIPADVPVAETIQASMEALAARRTERLDAAKIKNP